jgi:NLI interacting factor-like phosphatase
MEELPSTDSMDIGNSTSPDPDEIAAATTAAMVARQKREKGFARLESEALLKNALKKNRESVESALASKGRRPCRHPAERITPMMRPPEETIQPMENASQDVIDEILVGRSIPQPEIVPRRNEGVLTVVLDLDDTLICVRNGSMYVRPHARDFLTYLSTVLDHKGRRAIEIVVWSAGDRGHVDRAVHLLDPDFTLIHHAICRGPWMDAIPVLKNLSMLSFKDVARDWGGRKGSCVLVDDNPHASVCNGHAALIIPNFQPEHPAAPADTTLLYVLQVLVRASHIMSHVVHRDISALCGAGKKIHFHSQSTQCASSSIDAADYLADHPFTNEVEVTTGHGSVRCLKLDVSDQESVAARIRDFRALRQMLTQQFLKTTSTTTVPGVVPPSFHSPRLVDGITHRGDGVDIRQWLVSSCVVVDGSVERDS